MTRDQLKLFPPALPEAIQELIAHHGRLRLLHSASIAVLFKPKGRRPYARSLPAHLQRDIGLTPNADPPQCWDLLIR